MSKVSCPTTHLALRRALLQEARMRRAETAARRLHRDLPLSSPGKRGGPHCPMSQATLQGRDSYDSFQK